MTTVQILGRVFPTVAQVTVAMPDLDWEWEQEALTFRFRVKVANSLINIECETERYKPEYFVEVLKRAQDLAQAAVEVVAFAEGLGLTVVLETVIGPDGMPSAILPRDPAIPSLVTAYKLDPPGNPDQAAIYQIVVGEAPLMRALHDLIEAITVPHIATVNCGRVIDSIRRMITPPGTISDKQAWQAMQTALNVSQEYQNWISVQATGPRHGDPAFVSGDIVTEAAHRTWAVMNRFLEYRKRGNQALSAPEFPLLV